jgi:hypothetical protein
MEEEKKLVAEWMGWEISPLQKNVYFKRGIGYNFDDWNPHQDRNCWPEIWDKLASIDIYLEKYLDEMDLQFTNSKYLHGDKWDYHTASPEICWKALVKTLTERQHENS